MSKESPESQKPSTTAFVIANDGNDYIDSPVFYAGPEQQQEAIAVFTHRQLAQDYITDAGWDDEYSVAELADDELLKFFEFAHEDDVDMVAINLSAPTLPAAIPMHVSAVKSDRLTRAKRSFDDRQVVLFLNDPQDAFDRFQAETVTSS